MRIAPAAIVLRVLLAIGVLTACGCGQPAALDRLAAGERGRVVRVQSGHVLVMDSGLVVRLAGIEAPTLSQPHGVAARESLSRLALGQEVQLFYGGQRRDRYDRALAHVRTARSRAWVEGKMLSNGDARVRTWSDNRAMAAEMLETEARARRQGKGLWGLAAYRVLLPQEAGKARGFQVIEGRIARTGRSSTRLYLDFAEAGFSGEIPLTQAVQFKDADKAPEDLTGRLVRVRGTVAGHSVRLDHPEALEILKSR